MRVQKLSYSSIFIKNNNNLYSRILFFPYIIELFSVFAVKRQKQRGKKNKKIVTSYLVCIFFLCVCCLLPKYKKKNVATHCQYPQSGWDSCSQRSHCMTTDLCSSFETDTAEPLPANPGGPGRRRHTSAPKNTRLSAGASVKTSSLAT